MGKELFCLGVIFVGKKQFVCLLVFASLDKLPCFVYVVKDVGPVFYLPECTDSADNKGN